MTEKQEQAMDLIDHLGELRKRLMITAVSFFLFLIIAFIFVQDIYQFFVKDIPFKLTVISPTEVIWVYFMLSGLAAIAGTIPILAWQIWGFVKPGLTEKERKLTLGYIPALFILFLVGLSFGYYVMLPLILKFLMNLSEDMFTTMFTTEKYFQFVLRMTIPFSFLFELPVLVMFLTSLGIIDPQKLTKIRKYAYFILVIIAAVVTPPDLLSEILVMIPLFFLYECSILLSKIVHRRKLKKDAEVRSD